MKELDIFENAKQVADFINATWTDEQKENAKQDRAAIEATYIGNKKTPYWDSNPDI